MKWYAQEPQVVRGKFISLVEISHQFHAAQWYYLKIWSMYGYRSYESLCNNDYKLLSV